MRDRPVPGRQGPASRVQGSRHRCERSDVVLPAAQAGFVDAHDAHLAHVLFAPGLGDTVFDAPSQLRVLDAQHLGRLAHRQALAQCQCQRLKQQRASRWPRAPTARAAARSCHGPGTPYAARRHAARLRTGRSPGGATSAPSGRARAARLRRSLGGRASWPRTPHQSRCGVPGGVELHISNGRRRLQSRCAGEQRFDLNVQDVNSGNSPVDM